MSDPKRMSECLNHSAVDTWSSKDVSFKRWVDEGKGVARGGPGVPVTPPL